MALLPNTATALTEKPATEKKAESIFTATQQLKTPTSVGGRMVEVVPQASGQPVPASRTVQGQLSSILASGSPLMRQAKARAAMAAADKGLHNSSIAVQAGEEAMISSALPIAQQDAGQEHQLFVQDKDHSFTAGENSANRSHQLSMQGADHSFQSGENSANRAFQSGESAADRKFRLQQEERSMAFQTADREDQQLHQSGESAAERQMRERQEQAARDNQLRLQSNDHTFSAGESAAERQLRERQEQLARDNQLRLQSNDQTFSSQENKAAREFSGEQARLGDERQLENSRTLQELEAKNNLAMEDIRFEHQQTISSNATAQAIYQNHQQAVASIMSQPGMTPSQAGAALKILNQTTKDNLALAGSLSGIDLSKFAPSGAVSGSSTVDKKGNVTNTFSVGGEAIGADGQPALQQIGEDNKLISSYGLNNPKDQLKIENAFKNPLALKDKNSAKNLEPVNLAKKVFKLF